MIELISRERCIGCHQCVTVCPTNVFDVSPDDPVPTIARKTDCQTCFMCKLYCPVDALYVTPYAEAEMPVEERELAASGLLGSYRAHVGWGKGRVPAAAEDASYLILQRMRAPH